MIANLRRKWAKAVNVGYEAGFVRGVLGRTNTAGGVDMEVADRPGYLHVTLSHEGTQTTDVAFNMGVKAEPGLAVKMRVEDGRLVIFGADSSAGNSVAGGSTGPHHHNYPSGLEYVHHSFWFEPGYVAWAGAGTPLGVTIRPFLYHHGGQSKRYPGGTLSLSASLPLATNRWAWVIVGVNPSTNAAVAVRGAEYATQAELTDARIADINFGNHIPLAAVQTFNGDTALSSISRYRDARRWLAAPTFAISSYIDSSDGPTDAGKPIVTTDLGTIGRSLLPPFQSFGIGLHFHAGAEIEDADLPLGIISGGEEGCDNGAWVEWFVIADPLGTPVAGAGAQYVAPAGSVSIAPGTDTLDLEFVADGNVRLTGALTVTHKISLRFHWIH